MLCITTLTYVLNFKKFSSASCKTNDMKHAYADVQNKPHTLVLLYFKIESSCINVLPT